MSLDLLVSELRKALPELLILENEPMSKHTSFRIGGPVRALVQPQSAEEVSAVCRLLRDAGVKPLILGNGTNLLVTDEPLNRVAVQFGERMSAIVPEGETGLRAECGVTLARLAGEAQRLGLAGLEFAHGIPGSLGGGVSMDAGAYGGELKDVVVSTRYLDEDLNLCECVGDEHDFAYRHSRFSDTDCVILESTVRLTPDDPEAIMERMMTLREKRRASQPLEMPSAGSTFKRPVGGYAAALIDQAGLKGYAIGGAQVSEKHGGFVINRGGATFDDVLRLIEHIRETVYRNSGITLETEVKIIRE